MRKSALAEPLDEDGCSCSRANGTTSTAISVAKSAGEVRPIGIAEKVQETLDKERNSDQKGNDESKLLV